ncbi:HD domain-containing phosphohydrolase [Nocardioides marmorisolisilvae]|uniref:HD domain-containing protein n=1 Tax=Nocardioides marmorisolisilvae TaxID=1542737 RepID=A0A3N0DRT0_9ACTN|nr:HD domain-containing phosphohydrolase [Nocardioides marmorisolisilvae]RNL78332.1 HD domain-containing protein [Nocardioides marmorisolisilvae]
MERGSDPGGVRLAELVAALSLGIDLGFSQPMEHVLRQCLIALRLAELVGLDDDTRASVYYSAMLVNVGCHSDAHEQAKWFGDDLEMKGDKYLYGLRGLRGAVAMLSRIGSGSDTTIGRLRVGLEFATSGYKDVDDMIVNHATLACRLADELALPGETPKALGASYEMWDGHGWPGEMRGEEIPVASRIATLAEFVEVAHRVHGVEAARELARRQRGKQFDPAIADLFLAKADDVLAGLDDVDSWEAVIEAEPALGVRLDDAGFDSALTAIADFVDLKSPYTLGHGRAVAELVDAAAVQLGMRDPDRNLVRRSALVHAFGKLGVSNAILDKATPLGAGERERLRMIPFVTHRMLRQSPALSQLGAIALQHAERLDGSGHPNGLSGAMISREARLLGAADVYQSLREPRAYREALSPDEAATRLRSEVRAGRLDADCVEAVLAAAGHRVSKRSAGPAGLTAREIDVLRLIARGMSTKDVAERLVISRKTVSNHVEHIYTKIGASNRATAALFATQHGLLVAEETVPV